MVTKARQQWGSMLAILAYLESNKYKNWPCFPLLQWSCIYRFLKEKPRSGGLSPWTFYTILEEAFVFPGSDAEKC